MHRGDDRLRKFIAFFLIISVLVIAGGSRAFADEDAIPAPLTIPEDSPSTFLWDEFEGWPVGPDVQPRAAIIMDMDTGAVLYGKNIHEAHYPASITKVMTALVAVENGDPNQAVPFSHDAVYNIEPGSANVGMHEGEVINLDTALRCLMSASANECAYAIAESVGGGDYATFIQMMNDKAQELGCLDSHFANPHGLHDLEHYVSAYDMALIATAAYNNEWFRSFCNLQTYRRPLTEMNPEDDWVINNKHKMFKEDPDNKYYYSYCTGGKTGFTDQARTTLVTYAEKDGHRLVCVTLQGAGTAVYDATRGLFDYCFENFSNVPASELIDDRKIINVKDDTLISVPNSFERDKIETVEVIDEVVSCNSGSVGFAYGGIDLGHCSVNYKLAYIKEVDDKLIKDETPLNVPSIVKESGKRTVGMEMLPYVLAGGVLLILILTFIVISVRRRRNRSGKEGKGLSGGETDDPEINSGAGPNTETSEEAAEGKTAVLKTEGNMINIHNK